MVKSECDVTFTPTLTGKEFALVTRALRGDLKHKHEIREAQELCEKMMKDKLRMLRDHENVLRRAFDRLNTAAQALKSADGDETCDQPPLQERASGQ